MKTIIVRREILPSGKSRPLYDSPVNLQVLQERFFIDIHSQQQTRELSDERMFNLI
jgi:DNA repair protein RecN (Recombination protein N)